LKRDDLNAPADAVGGNKVRALEWLLGGRVAGDTVVTAGGDGSTHVLATAVHARRLGVDTVAVRWRHDMHPLADAVAARSLHICTHTVSTSSAVSGLARLALIRLSHPAYHYIPPGGSTPLGTLGHVDAALELAAQVDAGLLPPPAYVVVPFGTGGTAAGLSIGLGIAGLHSTVIAVRVVPRIAFPVWRLRRLIQTTRTLIGRGLPGPAPIEIDHTRFGGAYGRPLAGGETTRQLFERMPGPTPPRLDDSYSGKAARTALALAARPGAPTRRGWRSVAGPPGAAG
jgi:D-cysteine desulfhydrase